MLSCAAAGRSKNKTVNENLTTFPPGDIYKPQSKTGREAWVTRDCREEGVGGDRTTTAPMQRGHRREVTGRQRGSNVSMLPEEVRGKGRRYPGQGCRSRMS